MNLTQPEEPTCLITKSTLEKFSKLGNKEAHKKDGKKE